MLNQEFELQWQSRYASGCSANGAWQGDKETSGTHKVVSTGAGPQTFQLICFGDKGSESAEVVVIGLSEGLDEWSGTKVPSYMDGHQQSLSYSITAPELVWKVGQRVWNTNRLTHPALASSFLLGSSSYKTWAGVGRAIRLVRLLAKLFWRQLD